MLLKGIVIICLLFLRAYSQRCYWNATDNYRYFATITPYDDVRGDIRDGPFLKGCHPVSLWLIARHGMRHPGEKHLEEMKRAAEFKDKIVSQFHEGKGKMCAEDISHLDKWKWDEGIETPNHLTVQGHKELKHLGQRVQEKYSHLLGKLDKHQFRPTNTQRTKASAKAFVEGLKEKFNIEDPLKEDDVIEPWEHCEQYLNNHEEKTKEEHKKFEKTKVFKQMLSSVRKRVGLKDLTEHDVKAFYHLCSFYRAYTDDRRDPWCSVFRNEDLLVLEYWEDLKSIYSTSYGCPTASKLGAMPLQNLYHNLKASVKGSRRLTGYFSHDTMMAMTFTALGLRHDDPVPDGTDMPRKRKWRSSLLTPFASNLIVVLNKCNAGKQKGEDTYKVQVFMNEKAIKVCKHHACDWKDFKKKMKPFEKANLDFCKD